MTAPLSIQLYTLREQAKNGLAPLIRWLGEIGYAGVEPAGLHDLTPSEFRTCVGYVPLIQQGRRGEVLG